jgi:hypothetical protein
MLLLWRWWIFRLINRMGNLDELIKYKLSNSIEHGVKCCTVSTSVMLWMISLLTAGSKFIKCESSGITCFHVGFFLGLFFSHEDVGDMFLRNVDWLSTDYMVLYPRRQNSSKLPLWEPQILQMKQTSVVYRASIFSYRADTKNITGPENGMKRRVKSHAYHTVRYASKLFSPQANYIDRATAACWRS